MDNYLNKFSLKDFLLYLFPGLLGMVGVYFFVTLGQSLSSLTFDIPFLIITLSFSYLFGILASGICEPLVDILDSFLDRRKQFSKNGQIIPGRFSKEVIEQFKVVFPDFQILDDDWNSDYYYIIRSLIYYLLPTHGAIIRRQGDFRVLRINLFLPVIIWLATGLRLVLVQQAPIEIIILAALSLLVLGVIIMWSLYQKLNQNRRRETRDVYLAFLTAKACGLLENKVSLPTDPGERSEK